MERRLKDLSIRTLEADDDGERAEARLGFTRLFGEYKINERYVRGYGRNREEYETLATNLSTLVEIFVKLQDSFTQLIANLEMEKEFLMDNIRLQADSIRVKAVVHEAINEGNLAIRNISEKLALLYTQVEGFAGVHERINDGLGQFVESQKVLSSVAMQIDQVGALEAAPNIDSAIEYFYDKRLEEEE